MMHYCVPDPVCFIGTHTYTPATLRSYAVSGWHGRMLIPVFAFVNISMYILNHLTVITRKEHEKQIKGTSTGDRFHCGTAKSNIFEAHYIFYAPDNYLHITAVVD